MPQTNQWRKSLSKITLSKSCEKAGLHFSLQVKAPIIFRLSALSSYSGGQVSVAAMRTFTMRPRRGDRAQSPPTPCGAFKFLPFYPVSEQPQQKRACSFQPPFVSFSYLSRPYPPFDPSSCPFPIFRVSFPKSCIPLLSTLSLPSPLHPPFPLSPRPSPIFCSSPRIFLFPLFPHRLLAISSHLLAFSHVFLSLTPISSFRIFAFNLFLLLSVFQRVSLSRAPPQRASPGAIPPGLLLSMPYQIETPHRFSSPPQCVA